MAQLKRIGASEPVEGVGFVRRGVIHAVPDHLVPDLLASGEWREVDAPQSEPERVTEPAPSTPAKPRAKRKAVKRK